MEQALATDNGASADPLDPQVAALFAGPLDSFVARRDALAKELRADGRRDDARAIKAIRKPKRMAWALNVAALKEPAAVEAVAAAVTDAVAAQAGAGDLRSSLAALRETVRNLAAVASRLAWAAEQSVDPGQLADAIMAVVGAREAFEMLRAARLVDIPEAGGIELLSGPVPEGLATQTGKPSAAESSAGSEIGAASPPQPDPAALEALRRAEAVLAAARDRLTSAEQALVEMDEATAAAERRLVIAQTEAAARRKDVDRSRAEAEAAAAAVAEAERRLADARRDIHTD
jgi:hypothetical protein